MCPLHLSGQHFKVVSNLMLNCGLFQAAIWHCLNHYNYWNATFLAEKLQAESESPSDDHLG